MSAPPAPAAPSAPPDAASAAASAAAPSHMGGTFDRPLAGIGYAVLSVFAFSVLDVLAKAAVALLPTFQILAIRSVMVLVAIAPVIRYLGGWRAIRTRQPWVHATRGLCSIGALWTFFEALRLLPLATVIALSFSGPLWMTALSVPLLGEHVGIHRWAAVAVGFAGVAVIMGPEALGGAISWGAWLTVASSLFFALSNLLVRRLVRTDGDLAMVFYQNLAQLLAGSIGSLFEWQPVSGVALGIVAGTAGALIAGQVLAARALRRAPVGAVAPFHYTALVWAALFGWLIWNEWPEDNVWLGTGIVVAAGLYVAWRERLAIRRRRAAARAAEPAP
ncbi:MAG: DMT family transporter [Alphaproteobacteria bacterium]|nr:DMT family transporter [Alphaproteobacteria bacterium]